MKKEIKILHLEDSLIDSELIHSYIECEGIGHEYFLVDSEKDFINTLGTENIDIILSDYSLPDYSGSEAMNFVMEKYPYIPFLFVSGAMGEDAAINAMLNGATDYVLKNKLERLVPAIKRALHECENENKRKLAEKSLMESQMMLQKARKLAHLGVWNWEEDIDRVTWTEELYQIAGLDPTVPAPTYAEHQAMYSPQSWHLLESAVEEALHSGKPYQLELELIQPDKSIRNVIAFGDTHFNETGQINGLYGTVQDITDRKRVEQELIISNKELSFQNEEKGKRAAELIVANNELAFQNKEKGKRAAELIIANDELAFQNKEKGKRADELIVANNELLFQNKEKEKRAIELIIAKEKAEESDRLKSAFLANMSHEIRTPMNGILGFADLLKELNLSGEKQQEYIDTIEKSGVRMLNIINDIMCISKVESGQLELSLSEANINEQIEYIYTFFKPEAEKKGLQFSFKITLPTNEAIIKTDREKVYAILTNLVKNALKFTNKGSIEFGYAKKSDYLEFFVKDTGIGIRPEQKGIIFERFRQVSESYSRDYEGAGLGLSISKAYVEMLGGKIWVEGEIGKGSVFYFTLPFNSIVDTKVDVKNSASGKLQENQIKKLNILIAEDDLISEKLITMAVKIFSKEVLIVRTGIDAVKACRNHPDIDLILMDIRMPVIDGYEATRQIRKFNEDVIIIAQTAFALSGDRIKAIKAGCNDYISKPIKKDLLVELLLKYFKK